jgi:hypothetical protein
VSFRVVFGQFHYEMGLDEIQLKCKNSAFTFLHEEEFDFVGKICTLYGK